MLGLTWGISAICDVATRLLAQEEHASGIEIAQGNGAIPRGVSSNPLRTAPVALKRL